MTGYKLFCIAGLLIAAGLMAGCSGIRPYPNDLAKNMRIQTETKSGSVFSSLRASVDIYKVDKNCQVDYQGTVRLDKPSVMVGMPQNKLGYVVVRFNSSCFLCGSSSSMRQEILLKPRRGYNYDVKVKYIDDIYDVRIMEKHPQKSKKGRELEHRDLNDCKVS